MNTKLISFLVIFLCCACSSLRPSQEFNSPIEKSLPTTLSLNLLSPARVMVSQKIKEVCTQKTVQALRVSYQSKKEKQWIPLTSTCSRRNTWSATSKSDLPAGEYNLKIESFLEEKSVSENPLLEVFYKNAEFASDTDQIIGGGPSLEAGQTLKGTVNYNAGDQSDWISLKGEQTTLSVTFLSEEESPEVEMQVFKLNPESTTPTLVTSLFPGKEKRLLLKQNNLFIRAQSKRTPGEKAYTLVRRDITQGKSKILGVLDLYPVSETSSIALIQNSDGLKVGDSVVITGVDSGEKSGKSQTLGRCSVTSVGKEQASCLLERSSKIKLTQLSAVFYGGSGS